MSMFRFTLRDLFWATLVVGLGLGWWLHVRQLESELAATQSDLLYQADLVDNFVSVMTKQLKCEIPADTGQYTKIIYPDQLTSTFGIISSTLGAPREQLERTLDGEFGVRFRASPSVQAARAATSNGP